MKKFGYSRKEKLKQDKDISLLFEKGKWKTCGNIRIKFLKLPEDTDGFNILDNPKVGVSVSKSFFKKAVHRNRIKRLLREVYRLNKNAFSEKFGTRTLAMLFWNSKEIPYNYKDVEKNFLKLCENLKTS